MRVPGDPDAAVRHVRERCLEAERGWKAWYGRQRRREARARVVRPTDAESLNGTSSCSASKRRRGAPPGRARSF